MKRLLQSSKFWVALGSLVAAVLVTLGFGDERADQTAELVVGLLKWFGTVWIGATAVEDAAKHLAAGKSINRGSMLGCWLVLLLFVPGCSLLNPGGDVRQATESRQTTAYTADGSFNAAEDTTHNRRNVLAESTNPEGGVMEWYEDGTPKRAEGMSNIMTQASEPKDASAAYAQLAIENARFGGKVMDTFSALLPLLITRGAAPPSASANQPVSIDEVRAFLEVLRQQPATTAKRTQPQP